MNIKRTNKLKTNSSGFGHIEMLLIAVAIVVIAGVGFFVYNNNNKKKAHAGGWTLLNMQDGHAIWGCWNGQWGNYSEAKLAYTKGASTGVTDNKLWYHTFTYNNTAQHSYDDRGQADVYWAGTIAVQKVAFNITHNVDVYYGIGPFGNQVYLHRSVANIKAYWNRC